MISGIEFQKNCNWNICNRYQIKFDPSYIEEGDFIFINTDTINQFIQILKSLKIQKINLVCHNSDLSFSKKMLDELRDYVNHIYAVNCIVEDDIITKIPLGFSDRLIPIILNTSLSKSKEYLLYMNFNIHSGRIKERVECRNYFINFDWIKFEDLVSEEQYYKNLSSSKYSLCPIGAGLDTHRFYESIFFDTIPIVKRNEISDLHIKFPCIVVNNWDDINQYYLSDNYQDYSKMILEWKKNNPNWLDAKFWI
jgi:hypothetical protein